MQIKHSTSCNRSPMAGCGVLQGGLWELDSYIINERHPVCKAFQRVKQAGKGEKWHLISNSGNSGLANG